MAVSAITRGTIRTGGIDLHYKVRGRGEPLVLLHGFTGSSSDWEQLFDMEALESEYQLVMPDMRGHGESTNPSKTLTHRQCALDVFALLDQLGIDRFKAVGVSFGGNVLLHMATQKPSCIEAMVTVGSPSYFPQQARTFMAGFTAESRTSAEWQMMRERHKHGDDQIRALWQQGNAFKDSYEDMNFTPPYLGTIRARTLIVTGDRDPLYPVEIFVEQYRSIPHSSLLVLPNGGHDAVFREARGLFVQTALAFLRDGTSSSQSSKLFEPIVPSSVRRHAPATQRNREPILGVLARVFPSQALVLEVASGSGEHAVFFGAHLPHLTWQPSDIDPNLLASIDAWSSGENLSNVKKAMYLDATSNAWNIDSADGIVCINMIHIAPPEACDGLLQGASRTLKIAGALVLYGPFREGGRHTAPSNERFDADLRARNPSWGVRNLDDVVTQASQLGLRHTETVRMPANNLTVVFRRE